jgi:hypothetical protein
MSERSHEPERTPEEENARMRHVLEHARARCRKVSDMCMQVVVREDGEPTNGRDEEGALPEG